MNRKQRLFFENAKMLNEIFGIIPLMYGSLGLEYLTGADLHADDIDILIPKEFIFDNWTDYELYIYGKDEVSIESKEDGIEIAALFFVDADTMWYWGSNEYVAVYKRTKPVKITFTNTTINERDSETIERILNRKIFELKDSFPEMYAVGVNSLKSIMYAKDWTFGRILNEDIFETLSWNVKEIDNRVKLVDFVGTLHTNGRIDNIKINFYLQEDATIPLALSMYINDLELSLQAYLDKGMEIEAASFCNDIAIAKALTIMYAASDSYVENRSEIATASVSNSDMTLIKKVLDRKQGMDILKT